MFESESVLLQRFARTGDSEAFSELVRRYAGLVYGACLRILADKDRAADAVQDTFFQLLRNAEDITGPLPNWLHRVATRKAIDVLRRDSSRKQREVQYAANKPLEVMKWQDLSPYVDEMLEELDDDTRQVLIHHYFEGKTTTDIAARQGLSQPTVSRKIESGVERLREKLRRRGIIIGAATLVSLLGENAVQAAPALVLKELGKMALVGGQAVVASGAAGTASAAGAGGKAVVGGVLTGVKAKIITAAAVTALGIGSVVTYQQITEPSRPIDEPAAEEVTQIYSRGPSDRTRGRRSAPNSRSIAGQPEELADVPSQPEWNNESMADSDFVESVGVTGAPEQAGDADSMGGDGGDAEYVGAAGMAMGGIAGGESSSEGDQGPPAGYGGYGGGYGGFGGRAEDPNEPNKPDEDSSSDER